MFKMNDQKNVQNVAMNSNAQLSIMLKLNIMPNLSICPNKE